MKKLMMIAISSLLTMAFATAQDAPSADLAKDAGTAVKKDTSKIMPEGQMKGGCKGRMQEGEMKGKGCGEMDRQMMRPGQGIPEGEMKGGCKSRMQEGEMKGKGCGEMDKQMSEGGCMSKGPGQEMMENRLREIDPKKYEEISKLRKQAMEMTRELMEKARKDQEDFRKLVEKYRETKADADKAAIKAKIEERVKNSLETQKQRLSEEEKNVQSKVDSMLNDIVSGKGCGKDNKN